jgi:pimeloyl-ACP methyl ester carboxylesterase
VKFQKPDVREIADLFSLPLYAHGDVLYATPQRPNYADFEDEALTRAARNYATFARMAWSPTLYDPKLLQRLHRIDVPTLVVWGDQDRVVPAIGYGDRFADAIPGATFAHVRDAGHYVHADRPADFVRIIKEFSDAGSRQAQMATDRGDAS